MKFTYTNTLLASSFLFVSGLNSAKGQSIAAGGWHSLVICNDSTVKAFGENASSQLGDGTTTDRNTPVAVAGLTGIIAVSAGGDQLEAHSMALKSNGTVWSWGSNVHMGLGNGSSNSSTVPVQAQGLTAVKMISAGGWHSVALKNDGTVWCWGWNADGQIGDGTTTDRSVPTQVPGLTNVIKIVAGTYHVLALKSDGTVWAWGDNVSGQVGNGTTTDQLTPVQVSGLTNVKAIAAGRFFSLAIKEDGTVWTWGENLYGQLGIGNTTDKTTPVQVTGLTNVVSAAVATGAFHCLALKNDGSLWSWGRNTYGNLGDNSITNSNVPVQVSGVSNITSLAAGTNFSLLQKNDGTFWACGRNSSGQLGDGSTTQRNTFTQASGVCSVMQPVGIVESEKLKLSAVVFPNPSDNGMFTIQLRDFFGNNSEVKSGRVVLYNACGQIILEGMAADFMSSNNIQIVIPTQPKGVYFFTYSDQNGITTIKLINE